MKSEVAKTQDRITFSIGRKVNVGRYENLDIFVGYSSDVAGESVDLAFQRVEKKTIREFEKIMGMVGDGKIEGAEKKEE